MSSVVLTVVSIERLLVVFNVDLKRKVSIKNNAKTEHSVNESTTNHSLLIRLLPRYHRIKKIIFLIGLILFLINSHFFAFMDIHKLSLDELSEKLSYILNSSTFQELSPNPKIYICYPRAKTYYNFFLNQVCIL
jgi:hypothetical protein